MGEAAVEYRVGETITMAGTVMKPVDLGFDPKQFPEYRRDRCGHEVQWDAIEFAANCEARVCGISVPTGVGKSLIGVSLAKLTGCRTVCLTATKGLQEQYSQNFSRYGMVDLRGKANYQCKDHIGMNCRDGERMGCICKGAVGKGSNCSYDMVKVKARNAKLVNTNYAYWMGVNDKAYGLERTEREVEEYGENPVEMLVLDEGTLAPGLLSDYLGVKLNEFDVKRWANPKVIGEDVGEWRRVAEQAGVELEVEIATLANEIKDRIKTSIDRHLMSKVKEDMVMVNRLEMLKQKYDKIADMEGEDLVIEKRDGTRYGRAWSFDVVWPGRYTEKYLFCNVPKVVIMSATLRPKTLGLLGVGKEESEFREWERVFPANRHPIYSIPAVSNGKEVRIDRRTSETDMQAWVEHIDCIIGGRLDRRGIIQTVSYDRQRYLLDHSRYSEYMLGNTGEPDSDTALQVAEQFRNRPAPVILVSPSFSTGWDFPGSECEYVIICKIPFKPNMGKVQKVREEKDPQYGAYLAMQEMVQGCGRGMRSEGDRCEVFLTDAHLNWFLYKNKGLAPGWFANSVRKVNKIPAAAPKL